VRGCAVLSLAAWLCLACAGSKGGDVPPVDEARLQVAMWSGFEAAAAPLPPYRTALVVDSGRSMSRKNEDGVSHILAARLAAKRFVEAATTRAPLDVFVVAGERAATCDAPTVEPLPGDRSVIAASVGRLRARGKGSVGATLLALADSPDPLERVVVVTNLFEECGSDLCSAAAALADRGARLDVVAIGDIVAPDCLGTVHEADVEGVPVPWTSERPRRFHIKTTGSDPAILGWGLVNDIPVGVRTGELEIVVDLSPPLRVTRQFEAGASWKLEVLDFPSLEPPERQWRWQRMDATAPTP